MRGLGSLTIMVMYPPGRHVREVSSRSSRSTSRSRLAMKAVGTCFDRFPLSRLAGSGQQRLEAAYSVEQGIMETRHGGGREHRAADPRC